MSHHAFCRCASAILLACFAATAAHAATYSRSYLVNDVLLPTTSLEADDDAIDVDGDGVPDNNIGHLLADLSGSGFDFSDATHAAVTSGSIVHIVGLHSTDAMFENDPAAQATWCVGVPTAAPPKFDGTDNVSCADTSGTFIAALSTGSFTSPAPASTSNPVSIDVGLAIGGSITTLTVLNARLSFTTDADGNISVGQINGSIAHDEILNTFVPVMANACNTSIQSDPTANFSTTCKSFFDTGCTGSPNFAHDGFIEVCEIEENSLIHALIAPDVQVADGDTMVDANSIGFRFTAIAYDRVFANGFEL